MRKKVLITGGAGFVGAFVIDMIMKRTDWNIVCLDRLDYSGNLNRINEILMEHPEIERKRFKFVFHDLKAPLNPLVQSFIGDPNIILHLASGSHVDRSISHPMEFVLDNVCGGVNLLDYARSLKNLELFFNMGTDEQFGVAENGVNYTEHCRFNSRNPYSASKSAIEEFCVAYANTYGLPIICGRTMNIFGEMQTPEKMIPGSIDKINRGETVFIHANSDCTVSGSRYYLYGGDFADALFFLITERPSGPFDLGGIKTPKFNIVGKEETTNLDLAKMIANAQAKELKYKMVPFTAERAGHDLVYRLDGSYMKSLGWEPKISLTDRIQQVNDWYLANPRWLGY